MTSLLLGAQIGTRGTGQRATGQNAEVNRDLFLLVIGVNFLSDSLSISTLSLGFSADSDGIAIDPGTGEVRISSRQLMDGIAVVVTTFGAGGEISGKFNLAIALDTGVPAAPVATGALDNVTALIGSGPITVKAAADFVGEGLTFMANGPGATIDSASGLVTIATDALLSGEQIRVTASNAGGSATSTFQVTVKAVAPVMTVAPSLTGGGKIGAPVTVKPGTWDGRPAPELAVQWLLNGAEIQGVTGTEYTPVPADNLKALSCRVNATNAGGSAKAVTSPLTITYTAPELVGSLANVSVGKGTPPVSVKAADVFRGEALQFSVIGAGATIDAKTGTISIPTTTVLTAAKVLVTARNSGGTAEAAFNVTVTNTNILPLLLSAPVLLGKATIGQALTLDQGLWGGFPAPGLTLQWLRDGADIQGATGAEYRPVPADDLKAISCRVTATNVVGSAKAETKALTATYAAPVAAGKLPEEIFDQYTGVQKVETAQDFTGENLSFAVKGPNAGIDANTGIVSIPTGTASEGGIVTVSANNSGGTATSAFMVTVEADTSAPLALADDEWEIVECGWAPAGQTVTYQPKIRIDSGISVHAAQWTTSGYTPALEAHWETLAPIAGETHTFLTKMLHEGTGDWYLFQKGQTRSANFRIRYKTSAAGEWAAESGKKAILPPSSGQAPAAVTDWTLTAGPLDGQITITVPAGQPTSWGDGTAGTLQWWNASDGWKALTSPLTVILPLALHGTTAEIRVRGVSAKGIEGAETAKTVAVKKTVGVTECWMPFLMRGAGATRAGGELYQFFHGGDVFYNPNHPDDGKYALATMDVHAAWTCGNHSDEWPVLMSPETKGIRGRYGLCCKIDREQPNRQVIVTANHSASSRGGIWTSVNYCRNMTYKFDDHSNSRVASDTGIEFIGGQGGGGSSKWRAWHRLIQQSYANPNDWIVIGPRRSNRGGIILRSSDRAQSWTYSGDISHQYVYTLAQDAKGRLIYGSENGLHIAPNFNSNSFGSGSWPAGIPSAARTWVIGIECHPTDARYGYIATWNGSIYRTTDGFETFREIGLRTNSYCNVFASPWNFDNVWAIGSNNGGSSNGRFSAFSSNGLSTTPTWTEINDSRNDTNTYGWPRGVGDARINAPGSTTLADYQMQIGVIPAKHQASNHKRCLITYKGAHSSTSDGINYVLSGDGVDHTGAGEQDAYVMASSSTHPEFTLLAGYDSKSKKSRDGWQTWSSAGLGSTTLAATMAPNRPNGDWAAVVTGGYGGASVSWTKTLNGSPNWTSANVGSNNTFVAFGQGANGQSLLYTSFHRCTNFSGTPTFTALTSSSGFISGMRMVFVSATNTQVAFAIRSDRYLYRTTNGGETFTEFCDFGTGISSGFWVDPKDHDTVEWYHPQQGVRRYRNGVYSTIGPELAGVTGGNSAQRLRICPVSDTRYVWHRNLRFGRFGMFRQKGSGEFTAIDRHFPNTEAVRGMDICYHTGILFQLGTVGTRYFAPPTLNALAQERLNRIRALEAKYNGQATLAII
jgi:hypothetical protein